MTRPAPAHPPAVHVARHQDAVVLLGQRIEDAAGEDWPAWVVGLLDDTLARLMRHKPTTLPAGLRNRGPQPLRCAGHAPPDLPEHLLTVADFPVYPCVDTAATLDLLLGPLAPPEPEPEPAPPATTWSKTR